jgi:hypothetical protein
MVVATSRSAALNNALCWLKSSHLCIAVFQICINTHTRCQQQRVYGQRARYNICIRARGVKIKPEHYDCA